MARTVTGIDIGLRTGVFLRGSYKGNTFHATDFAVSANSSGDLLGGWSGVDIPFKAGVSRIGLSGRDLNVRYTRVPRVPDWQLRKLMRFEVAGVGGQSGAELASDFNLLPEMPEVEGEDIVLLAMAREELLAGHSAGLASVGGKLDSLSPNALALYNSWMRYGVIEGDTVLLANIGHDNVDVVICRGPDLVFARNLSGGSRLFDEAIAQRFGVSNHKAEEVKIEYANLDPNVRFENANEEKASRAILGAAGQLQSLLQSAVLFSKSQLRIPNLKIDRVLLCGGGAALTGLPAWLSSTMGVPVELFDPFRVVRTDDLDPAAAELLEEYKLEAVVALGLATMASDPEAYSVEILPAALRSKREFWGGTAWLLAAAVLAVAFLGWRFWFTSQALTTVEGDVSRMERQLKKADKTDKATRDLLSENGELSEYSLMLAGLVGSGEQLARCFEVLDDRLPEEFWISRIESQWGADAELGVHKGQDRPILSLEGRARQGTTSMATLYEVFLGAVRDSLPGVALKAAPSPKGTRFSIDLTLFAPVDAQTQEQQ